MGALTAMAVGTPVIALAGTATAELHIHGETGFIARDAEEAARYVDRLGSLRTANAEVRARIAFSPETAASAYGDLYAAVSAGHLPGYRHPELAPADPSTEDSGRELLAAY